MKLISLIWRVSAYDIQTLVRRYTDTRPTWTICRHGVYIRRRASMCYNLLLTYYRGINLFPTIRFYVRYTLLRTLEATTELSRIRVVIERGLGRRVSSRGLAVKHVNITKTHLNAVENKHDGVFELIIDSNYIQVVLNWTYQTWSPVWDPPITNCSRAVL